MQKQNQTQSKPDPDIEVLKACIEALDKSTSPKMLKANLLFLCDRYGVQQEPVLPSYMRQWQITEEPKF